MNKEHLVLLIILLVISGKSYAQNTSHNFGVGDKYIAAEWIKPSFEDYFDGNDQISFFSSVLFIKGSLPIGENLRLHVDLPFSRWGLEDGDGIDTQAPHTTIGNMYVGGSYRLGEIAEDVTPQIELGIRLPTLPEPEYSDELGVNIGNASIVERNEAFVDDIIPVYGFMNLDYQVNAVVTLRLRGGASYWVVGKDNSSENQLYLMQNIQVRFLTQEISGHLEIIGKYHFLPNDDFNRNKNHLRVGLSKSFGIWNVELYLRNTIKSSFFSSFQNAIGFQVNYHF